MKINTASETHIALLWYVYIGGSLENFMMN